MTSIRYSRSSNNAIKIANILNDESDVDGLRKNDYNRIKKLLKSSNIQIHLNQNDNDTLMHLAIRRKDAKLIEMFLNDSDLTMKNNFGETPYDLAVKLQCCEEILTKLLRDDEMILMQDMGEDYYIELRSKITPSDCDKMKFIKAAKIVDYEFVLSSAIDENFCDIFPNLFALQIQNLIHDEENCLKLIQNHFNDGRSMFVNFIASEKHFYKNEHSKDFNEITCDDNNARIINTKAMVMSEVVNLIKSNDTFAMRYLKLFRIPNEIKVVDRAIEFGSFEMFLAALSAPFDNTKNQNYQREISKMMKSIYDDRSILLAAVKSDKIEIIEFIIKHFKSDIKFLPFEQKKLIMNLINGKNLDDYLISLLNIDFPFPETVNINENIKILLNDRQKLRSDKLEDVEEFIEQYESVKIGYNELNQSALLYAIENKNIQIYSYMLSEGYRCEVPNERAKIQEIIRKLSDDDKKKLRIENLINSKSDGNNHIRLLTNKFVIFTHYESKDEFKINFNKIANYLTELNEIHEISKLLKFCAELHMLKVTFDCENERIDAVDPSAEHCLGIAYNDGSIIISAVNEREAKATLIHELTHIALVNYYENDFNPYFAQDDDSRREFEEISVEIQEQLETSDDQCDKIISSVFECYDEDEFHSELIVRILEILAYYKDDDEKINNLRRIYKKLFDFSEQHVTNALSIDDLAERLKVRSANKYFGLIQDIREARMRLKLSKKSKNTKKIEKITKSDENQLIVTNIPILALINIKNYLHNTQKSLYDSKNIFISPKYIENDQIYDDFQGILTNSFNTIVDFSANHHIRVLHDNSKLIIITIEEKLNEIKKVMSENDISYDEKTLTYTWNDLTSDSQDKLMQMEVKFQNKSKKLSEIIDSDVIDDELLLKMCCEHEISINAPSIEIDKFYIERNFAKVYQSFYENGKSLPMIEANEQIHLRYGNMKNEISGKFEPTLVKTKIDKYSMDEAIMKTSNEHTVLISDIGGSGKSRVLKEMSNKLMTSSEDWILFIDLRKYLSEFQQWEDERNFMKFFNAHFGMNLTEFERKCFEKFYKCGKVKILFDGFDEISPNCKEFVLELIKSIEFHDCSSTNDSQISSNVRNLQRSSSMIVNNHNQLWITTRMHLKIDLQTELKVNEVFCLEPLNAVDQINFLIKYWKSKNVKLNADESLEANARVLHSKFLNFTQNKGNLIGIMQQLQILAEISIKNQKLNISSIENFTIYDIYESSVRKFIEKWKSTTLGSETCDETQFERANFTTVHQYHALIAILNRESVDEIFSTLGDIWDLQSIARGGIITYENEKIFFIHATYAEFFIANFVIQQLKRPESWPHYEILMQLFCDILLNLQYITIQMFINDKIKDLEFSEKKIEIFAKHLSVNLTGNHFIFSLDHQYHNITKLLLKVLQKFSDKKIKSILNSRESFSLLFVCISSRSVQNSEIYDKIFNLTVNHLSDEEFIEMIGRNGNCNGFAILHSFADEDVSFDRVKQLMETIIAKCSASSVKNLLMTRSDDKITPILRIIILFTSKNFKKFKYIWKIYEKYLTKDEMIKEVYFDEIKCGAFVMAASTDNSQVFEYIYDRFTSKYDLNFIGMLRNSNYNPVYNVAQNLSISVHQVFWNCLLKEVAHDKSNRKKVRQLLFTVSEDGNNFILELMAFNDSCDILQLNLANIKNFIDDSKDILNILDISDQNLFQMSYETIKPKKYYQILWNFIKELLDNNNHKLQRFLNHPDVYMNNVFHLAITKNSRENIELLLNFAEDVGMRSGELKNFIMPKLWNGRVKNILQLVAYLNKSVEVHELAWSIVIKYKDSREIYSLINEIDENNMNLLQIAVAFNTMEVLDAISPNIRFYLQTNDKLINYIQKLGFQNNTLYELALKNNADVRTRMWTVVLFSEYGLENPMNNSTNDKSNISIQEKEGSSITFQVTLPLNIMPAQPNLSLCVYGKK